MTLEELLLSREEGDAINNQPLYYDFSYRKDLSLMIEVVIHSVRRIYYVIERIGIPFQSCLQALPSTMLGRALSFLEECYGYIPIRQNHGTGQGPA